MVLVIYLHRAALTLPIQISHCSDGFFFNSKPPYDSFLELHRYGTNKLLALRFDAQIKSTLRDVVLFFNFEPTEPIITGSTIKASVSLLVQMEF